MNKADIYIIAALARIGGVLAFWVQWRQDRRKPSATLEVRHDIQGFQRLRAMPWNSAWLQNQNLMPATKLTAFGLSPASRA